MSVRVPIPISVLAGVVSTLAACATNPVATQNHPAPPSATAEKVEEAPTQPDTSRPPMLSPKPAVRVKFAGHEDSLLRYRPSVNMPEITDENLLEGTGGQAAADRANRGGQTLGTIPRLVVLPCADGCRDNPDYNKAVAAFERNYDAAVRSGLWTYRGEIAVRVRWFHERGFFARQLPTLAQDVFAVSLPLEGKLVTLSYRESGKRDNMPALVVKASGVLAAMLTTEIGAGIKPFPLQALLPEHERSWLSKTNDLAAPVVVALDNLFGIEDVRSRIEPMTDADRELLPAVDGILANEVNPMTETVFLNDF